MELGLAGKKALVTGGSKGLGLGMVRGFLEEGCQVSFCARSKDNLGSLSETLEAYTGQWRSYVVDVKQEAQLAEFIAAAGKRMGGIDILVNNAGGTEQYGHFFELEEKDWLDSWNLNFMSAVNATRLAYPYLKDSEQGRIINVSSITALQPGSFNPHYSAAKAALINFSKHLASQLAGDNILVNTLAPGNFESAGWQSYLDAYATTNEMEREEAVINQTERVEESIPLGRMGRINEIVPLVLLAASRLSAWMTGSCIVVDGGKVRAVH